MPIRVESTVRSRVDWVYVAAVAGLVGFGSVVMISAASPLQQYAQVLQKQFVAAVVGGLLFAIGITFNYQVFQDQAKFIYAFMLALLVGVLLFGTLSRGQRAWFHLGFFSFQPSEFARIGLILVLANVLDRRARKAGELSTVLVVLAVTAPILGLILKQPDFSTTLTFFPIIIGMLFCAGAEPGHLAASLGYACVTMSAPVIYTFLQARYPMAATGSLPYFVQEVSRMGWATAAALILVAAVCGLAWRFSVWMRWQLKPGIFLAVAAVLAAGLLSGNLVNRQIKGYQRNRLVAYVAPQSDIQGASYNVHQSQIAIGSGGVWGKGLFAGTQSQLGFLPERHTDFIYAVVGEETGFLGSLAVLGLYLAILWRIVLAGRAARDRYGYLVCCGMACMLSFNLLVNVGMCLGLMPVVGIPLPLVSYGGSSLVITLWGLGIVGNIYARRYSLL